MKIKDILDSKGSEVVTIGPHATLRETLTTLVENKVGALPVLDNANTVLGIITERDIMREVHNQTPLDQKKVEDVMTQSITTGTLADDIEFVMSAMTEGRFRHMPVVENQELLGIISIGDVVKARLNQAQTEVTHLKDYIAGPIAS